MPAAAAKHVASLSVKINGAPLKPEIAANVVEVRVRDSLSLPASAVVRITDPQHEHVDNALFLPGNPIEIGMGGPPSAGGAPIFKGEIVALEPEFSEQGIVLSIQSYDKSHRLQRNRTVRTFKDVGVGDIVSTLTGEATLTGEVKYSGSGRYEFFQQSGETAREVIATLERDHDCRFFVRNGNYVFANASAVGDETVEVEYSQQLLSFRPRLTTVQQDKEVQVVGWDPKAKQAINGSAASAETTSNAGIQRSTLPGKFGDTKVLIADRHVDNTSEAAAMAKSALDRRADAHFEAEGRCVGTPEIKAGCKLKLKGVGTTFSGTYIVSSATHLYRGEKGYTTGFVISGRSERGLLDLVHPPEKRDFSRHMVVGLVTNVNDPDKLGRVKVKYPTLPSQSTPLESTWARVITLAASPSRGAMMLPEVDDEVVVAFENGDTRRPLVVGAVFNGKAKPGEEILQANDGSFAVVSNKKAFMHSKEDMTFKSDKKMIIEVTSDREEKIDGQIKLKAGTAYSIEAGSDIKVKGVSVTIEASGSLKLKGATVDIESSGPANFKGALVNVEASGPASLKGAMVNIG